MSSFGLENTIRDVMPYTDPTGGSHNSMLMRSYAETGPTWIYTSGDTVLRIEPCNEGTEVNLELNQGEFTLFYEEDQVLSYLSFDLYNVADAYLDTHAHEIPYEELQRAQAALEDIEENLEITLLPLESAIVVASDDTKTNTRINIPQLQQNNTILFREDHDIVSVLVNQTPETITLKVMMGDTFEFSTIFNRNINSFEAFLQNPTPQGASNHLQNILGAVL